MRQSLILISVFFLYACASNIPLEIRQDISEKAVPVNAVRTDIEAYVGDNVRWGGTIASVENLEHETWIEVVGRKLGSYGQPLNDNRSIGRFIVRIDGFLDPEIYHQERRITIYGVVESRIVRLIDDYPYNYPLVRSWSHYLWDDYYPPPHYVYPYHYPGYYGYPYVYYPYGVGAGVHYGHWFGRRSRLGFGFHHHHFW